ncbi:MAG: PHP domain-containing protein [Bacteroidetes bacterium]|nr:PHP domain-containing protein [Bacteroidota bacterium]
MKNSKNSFVHLHVHTSRSTWSSTISVPNLFARCKELGMGSVAITDHATVPGIQYFYPAAQKYNIKPIIGCEFRIAPKSRFDRSAKIGRRIGIKSYSARNELCRLRKSDQTRYSFPD